MKFSNAPLRAVELIPTKMLQQFSFLYIQTLHYDCSHIEVVHLLFCAHLIIILGVLKLDIIRSTPLLECLHQVICV